MEQKLLKELKLILDNDDLTLESNLKEEEDWDSIAMLSTSALTKDAFNQTLDDADFNNIETILDIVTILKEKNNA